MKNIVFERTVAHMPLLPIGKHAHSTERVWENNGQKSIDNTGV